MLKVMCGGLVVIAMVALSSIGAHALQVGEKAPLFEARSTQGTIRLVDYLGKKNVVLAFYFADFRPVCTGEMTVFQLHQKKFEKLNTQVLGVCADTIKTHQEFADKYDLRFPLISDEKGEISRLYDPGRVTYIIDKAGIVRFIQKGVPDNKVLLLELEKLAK